MRAEARPTGVGMQRTPYRKFGQCKSLGSFFKNFTTNKNNASRRNDLSVTGARSTV